MPGMPGAPGNQKSAGGATWNGARPSSGGEITGITGAGPISRISAIAESAVFSVQVLLTAVTVSEVSAVLCAPYVAW